VIRAFGSHSWCNEIIVVSDGSKDKTAETARSAGAKVIELPVNVGKGEAMEIGVREAAQEVIFFSDADIEGLTSSIISELAQPVLDGSCVMSTAIRGRPIYWMNRLLHFFPLLGGERVITKELWYSVPKEYRTRFKIETALNYYSKRLGGKHRYTVFREIRQITKEVKYGFPRGFWMRMKMFAEVFNVSVRLYIVEWIINKISILHETLQGL